MFTSKDFKPNLIRRPKFIKVAGRYVRDTKGREVELSCAKLGSSMERFNTGYPIGFHKWF